MDYQLIYPELSVINGYTPIERIFAIRGIVPEAINHYLNTTDRDVNDPLLLNNMERGAKMFIEHLAKNHKIFVQVDSDVDGFTSAAILINYAYRIAPSTAQNNFSYRLHEGKCHGILSDNVPDGIQLVVVPDAGSNDLAEHKKLRDRGIDVLVIDHHEVENPVQFACIINNQLGEYPNRTLSGAGVVYKFCQYIDSIIGQNYANDFLDLMALGVIADMMDLRDTETKHLVTKGLNHIVNPFLQAFFEKQAYKLNQEGINPTSIAFYIAPYINAVNRVGTQEEKMVMFESMLEYKANEMIPSTKRGHKGEDELRVEQSCRVCTNAKNHQSKICDASNEMIEEIIQDQDLLSHPVLVIQVNDDLDQNITGLLANQFTNKYLRPTLILRPEIETDENGEITRFDWMGSGRCPANVKLENFREFISNSGLVNYASGHASAFGVSIPEGKVERLIELFWLSLLWSGVMAKHMVKCFYCGETFDASKEPFVMARANRYAHVDCAEKHEASLTQEDKAKKELEDYIKKLLNITSLTPKIKKQLDKYVKEEKYTYSGIHRSLIYFYEIKHNPIDKANGGIGIVPYVYADAYNYYYNIWVAQQQNENKNIEEYKPNEIVIKIPPPERKIKKRKLFKFLDEEANDT